MTKGGLCTAAPLIYWIIGICYTEVACRSQLFTIVVDTEKQQKKTMSAVEVKFAKNAAG